MKERPILFSGPMVRALLDGSKTQTRRVVKGMALEWLSDARFTPEYVASTGNSMCPYGNPGDRLWVRESFALETPCEGEEPPLNDGRPIWRRPADDFDGVQPLWRMPHYKATDPTPDLTCERERCAQCRDNDYGPHWQPSIHMPRWASRILLEATDVRAQRLHDISAEDAIAEGLEWAGELSGCVLYRIPRSPDPPDVKRQSFIPTGLAPVPCYAALWNSINGANAWDANPWVWAISFKRIGP